MDHTAAAVLCPARISVYYLAGTGSGAVSGIMIDAVPGAKFMSGVPDSENSFSHCVLILALLDSACALAYHRFSFIWSLSSRHLCGLPVCQ